MHHVSKACFGECGIKSNHYHRQPHCDHCNGLMQLDPMMADDWYCTECGKDAS